MGATLRGLIVGACLCAPTQAAAQTLAQRIADAPADAAVRFEFAAAPGVCGNDDNIIVRTIRNGEVVTSVRHGSYSTTSRGQAMIGECELGPVEVVLSRSGGSISDVGIRIARGRPQHDIDLGSVTPQAAVDYLLSPAALQQANSSQAARRMITAATLADAESWPGLLAVARMRDLASNVRSNAIFYLGQAAADRALAGLEAVISDRTDDLEVRKAAVFSLAQGGGEQAVDRLIELARTHSEPAIRRDAMFWLGRSGSPKAIAFFEELLRAG